MNNKLKKNYLSIIMRLSLGGFAWAGIDYISSLLFKNKLINEN